MAGIDVGSMSAQMTDASVSLGVSTAKLQFVDRTSDERPIHLKYLNQIWPKLEARAYAYRHPMVEIGGLAKFKTTMLWATSHPDSGRDREDQVLVYVTPYSQPEGATFSTFDRVHVSPDR